ncbi:DUF5447 family protein [Pseudomonas sp. CR1201]
MNAFDCYRRFAPAEPCACSVCWCRRGQATRVLSRFLCCARRRRVWISRGIGRRVCPSASCCGKSRPGRRAPRCWRVAYGCGEPFDREP